MLTIVTPGRRGIRPTPQIVIDASSAGLPLGDTECGDQ